MPIAQLRPLLMTTSLKLVPLVVTVMVIATQLVFKAQHENTSRNDL